MRQMLREITVPLTGTRTSNAGAIHVQQRAGPE